MKTFNDLSKMVLPEKKISFLMLLSCTILIAQSCKYSTTKNEDLADKIEYLDTLVISPSVADTTKWELGNFVAIIDTSNKFNIECRIDKEAYHVSEYYTGYGRTKEYKWLAEDELAQYGKILEPTRKLKVMPHAYKVRIGFGRLAYTEWISADKIFPAPWHNTMQIKLNDSIYVKRFGDFKPYKGIVIETPDVPGAHFIIAYDGYDGKNVVNYDDVYKVIRPATIYDLEVGNIVYFDNMYWVMVVGIKDDAHIIVREEGFPPKDKIVPINTLQIFK